MLRETRLKETEWDYLLPLVQANINQTPVAMLDHMKHLISEQGTTLAVGKIEDERRNPDSNQWELLIQWKGLESHESSWDQLPAMYREIPSLVQSFADHLLNGAKRVGLVEELAEL
ncbi:hypothetical protein H310_04616 [Aphanomyces invadans]|uniref:Chromo domain-containing protein n=1 Tax=Aphanomyces invadans TaxID=157072 RepID=A0A024UF94_9STRA|nr:hypothetical protein H310_04616 [Aphanomyces invadans]ETW04308.1 hypothetical protein H310_04616 [Aphanomyces invadans]|eukprot:XP_008867264.1 hypothetical protein H310_04616 [Aphanomyces invadans]